MAGIQAIQIGTDWDPYLKTNSFTLTYNGLTWTTLGSYTPALYPYLSIVANSYEGCLITLSVYRKYTTGDVLSSVQLLRTTYTIKTHINYVNDRSTEFQVVNNFPYTLTTNNLATAQSTFPSPCKVQRKYYWHPYKKLFFFKDEDNAGNVNIIFTCFPYNSAPTSACDANFNLAGTPSFKSSQILAYTGAAGTNIEILEPIVFTQNSAYIGVVKFVSGANYQHGIYKLTFTGTSCTDYAAAIGTQIYLSGNTLAANKITTIGVVPYIYHYINVGMLD